MLLSKKVDQQLKNFWIFTYIFSIMLFNRHNSFKDGKHTCNKYLLNTYLYIVLTFNIIILLTLGLEYGNFEYRMNLLTLIGLFFQVSLVYFLCIQLTKK